VAVSGSTGSSFTIIVVLTVEVVLHVPSALTQYAVLAEGVTISEELSGPAERVHKSSRYHFQNAPVPGLPPCTVRVTESPGQILSLFLIIPVGGWDNN